MKLTTTKNYFLLTLVQIPVSLVGLAANGLDLLMILLDLQIRKCKFRLELGFWPQLRAKKIAKKPLNKMVDSCVCQTDREKAIEQILSCWMKKSNRTVANDRRIFEATKWGRQAVRNNHDRHLYAVLRPTRKENLDRIANVLRAMDAEAFARIYRKAEKLQCGKY